ncbi:MAG TPA: Fic family protein [Bacteroidales bacterium]|nr:Fic family protein [Bacteroidales bacterium]HQB56116.1 Fic family protein [Bacteroidales bacterium]
MWKELDILRKEYLGLGLSEVIDYEKFSMISIVYNSTKIEGCSLTENDTKLLLENDITAKGKPLTDHMMVKDHYSAFMFLKEISKQKQKISVDLIKKVAGLVMKNTGGIVNTMAGSFDTSAGDLRKAQVYVDRKYFPDFLKVENLLIKLVENVNQRIDTVSESEILKLSADIHYNLVNIHPFGDGNGRTSRLMMNYIQMYHNEPLIKIFTEDRAEYIEALNKTEELGDISIFRDFICSQQIKFYNAEIAKFKRKDKGFYLMF